MIIILLTNNMSVSCNDTRFMFNLNYEWVGVIYIHNIGNIFCCYTGTVVKNGTNYHHCIVIITIILEDECQIHFTIVTSYCWKLMAINNKE